GGGVVGWVKWPTKIVTAIDGSPFAPAGGSTSMTMPLRFGSVTSRSTTLTLVKPRSARTALYSLAVEFLPAKSGSPLWFALEPCRVISCPSGTVWPGAGLTPSTVSFGRSLSAGTTLTVRCNASSCALAVARDSPTRVLGIWTVLGPPHHL